MSNKILIAHIDHWDQNLGGAEQQLKYLADYLLKNGYEVHFIYPNRNNKTVKPSKIHTHPLNYKKWPGTLGHTWFVYQKAIKEKIQTINPDLIITRTYSSWGGIVAKYAKEKYIGHFHFIASNKETRIWNSAISWKKPFNRIERKLALHLYDGHTQLITQNKAQFQAIEKKFGIQPKLVTQMAPANNPLNIKKEETPLKIVWIANFKPVKRPEKFLNIVNAFRCSQQIKFVMIGGHKTKDYQKLITAHQKSPNFQYLGALPNKEVNSILDSAHILINTSDFEGFSNTFVQAWLRQVVVISLNSNPDGILTKQNIGFSPKSMPETIKLIEQLTKEKYRLKEMGKRARLWALDHHTTEKILEKVFKDATLK